jgi:hypothetical protein
MDSEKWFEWDTEKTTEESSPTPGSESEPEPKTDFQSESVVPPLASEPLASLEATESSPSPGVTLPTQKTPIPAQRPFNLWVEGEFTVEDREKLTDLLEREEFGIREVDLELQWETGRILLPQISEYAAMRVAQTLRESSLELKMHANMLEAEHLGTQKSPPSLTHTHAIHAAEAIPITSLESIGSTPEPEAWETIDTILVTGLLKEPEWKAEQTDAFSKLVESLKRELRYRAHIKRAEALIRFKAEVLTSPWPSASECRVQVSALAVKKSQAL